MDGTTVAPVDDRVNGDSAETAQANTHEPVDATVVEDAQEAPEAPGTDLVPALDHRAGLIIRAEQPDELLTKAGQIANSLKSFIEAQGLAVNVGGRRKHVEVGGWQALGALLGALGGTPLHAETVWTRRLVGDDGQLQRTRYTAEVTSYPKGKGPDKPVNVTTYDVDGYDWEARVEVRTPDGTVVGAAEAMCSRAEVKWGTREDFALRSMAETRAESRAFRRATGWIIHLAGYSPTPAEEMNGPEPPPQADEALTKRCASALRYLVESETAAAQAWRAITAGDGLTEPVARAIVAAAEAKVASPREEPTPARDPAPEPATAADEGVPYE